MPRGWEGVRPVTRRGPKGRVRTGWFLNLCLLACCVFKSRALGPYLPALLTPYVPWRSSSHSLGGAHAGAHRASLHLRIGGYRSMPRILRSETARASAAFAHVEFSSVNAKTIAQSCAGEAAKHARRIGARRRRDRPAREGAAICCRHADDSSSRPRHAAPFESDASTATNCKWVARLTGAAPRAAAKKRSETRHDVFTQRVVPFLRVCPH